MGKIIGFVKDKGGVGATTAVCCLLDFWHANGRRVVGVDADPAGYLMSWRNAAEDDQAPVSRCTGKGLRAAALRAAEDNDFVLVDTAGELASTEALITMGIADLLIVPVSVGGFDIEGASKTLTAIDEAAAIRGGAVPTQLLLCRMKRTKLGGSLRDALTEAQGDCLETELFDRTAYPEALVDGQGPWTAAPRSEAAKEVEHLAKEIEGGFSG